MVSKLMIFTFYLFRVCRQKIFISRENDPYAYRVSTRISNNSDCVVNICRVFIKYYCDSTNLRKVNEFTRSTPHSKYQDEFPTFAWAYVVISVHDTSFHKDYSVPWNNSVQIQHSHRIMFPIMMLILYRRWILPAVIIIIIEWIDDEPQIWL